MEENKNEEEKIQNEPNQEMQGVQEELENTTDRLKRLIAEFDNFKKRSAKERETLYTSILGDIACKLLPVLDNLEKAASSQTQDINYKQGVDLVLKQYVEMLKSFGIEEIESIRKDFWSWITWSSQYGTRRSFRRKGNKRGV